jgi:3-methylfumaryl-CoA hydratase
MRSPPPLMHWSFFLPVVAPCELGADGHPKRGGFMPPITLPRRMFAAADIVFEGGLCLGEAAVLTSTIANVSRKSGKSGDLVFVEVERVLSQADRVRVRERQTIVYREAGAATPAVREGHGVEGAESWRPTTTDLFRFSAVTFNAHRIHYDLPYARDEEGYPGLVVQGPFIAAKLFDLARRLSGRDLARFSFRAQAPTFAEQLLYLARGEAEGEVKAIRCDGVTAMSASYSTL